MNNENTLIKKFESKGLIIDKELYLKLPDSFEFIQACNDAKIAILGVDFFKVYNSIVVPVIPVKDINCSVFVDKNTDWNEIVRCCNDYSSKILKKEYSINNQLYCNFLLLEEEDM